MGFNKQTIRDYDIRGKRVLLRADYNVPLDMPHGESSRRGDPGYGKITDDYRIKQSIPTIEYLQKQGCSIVVCSHLGRPAKAGDPATSLRPVAERLGKLLGKHVQFVPDSIGEVAEKAAQGLKAGEVLLVENLRYHDEEEANDAGFAKQLAGLGEVFVQDGFGVVHRAHASTEGVTHFLPSVAGLLVEKEVSTITGVMEKPERPLMAIIGGAKISDKIDVLRRFIDIADFVAVGGAMANTFLLAEGIKIGHSLADKDDVPLAREIIEQARAKAKKQPFIFYLPQDGVVAKKMDKTAHTRIVDWDAHVIADIENYPKRPPRNANQVEADESIYDIGPFSGAFIAGGIQLANTVIWNGAMGVTETDGLQGPVGPFAHGTETVVDALLGEFGHRPFSVVGGGDTVGYIEERQLVGHFNHVSTGGGACMELMSGKKLPGVEALLDKKQSMVQ